MRDNIHMFSSIFAIFVYIIALYFSKKAFKDYNDIISTQKLLIDKQQKLLHLYLIKNKDN